MKKSIMIILVVAVFAAAAAAFALLGPKEGSLASDGQNTKEAALSENGDLIISASEVTETARFYTYNELDKKMEIIAVKASDGTIRTAFNTCQVCYSSGKGYYIQEGDSLICQNCGNRFGMDEVELTKGGCNPVPITDEYKTEADGVITIPKEFLEEAQVIFENWKI